MVVLSPRSGPAGLAALARIGKVGAMSLPQSLADIGLKAMSQVHRAIVHLSGGRVLGSALGMPAVELHTVGRKSGLPRSTMLSVRRARSYRPQSCGP